MSGVPLGLLSSPHYTNARRIDMTGKPTLPYSVKADHSKFAGPERLEWMAGEQTKFVVVWKRGRVGKANGSGAQERAFFAHPTICAI
jgi:hypothetical protein